MIPYYYLYIAKQSLIVAKETIVMMGGEDDCSQQILQQRDFLEMEVEYFREQSFKFTIRLLTVAIFCVTLGLLYFHYGVF